MKKLIVLFTATVLLVTACASFNRNAYNGQKLAADTVSGAIHGYNQWLSVTTNQLSVEALGRTLQQRDAIYGQVRDFARVEKALTAARLEYAANAANTNKTAVTALLDTLDKQAVSIAQLVKQLMQTGGH